jgi:hypothetical protein
MSRHEDIRAGDAITLLASADPFEVTIIQCLRAAHRAAREGSPAPPCRLGRDFAALHDIITAHVLGPIEIREPGATIVSPDEACIANILRAATEGDREEALMAAFALLRPDIAFLLVPLAQELGLNLRRAALSRGHGSGASRLH